MNNTVFLQAFSKSRASSCEKTLIFSATRGEMHEKYFVLQAFSKSRSFFVKNHWLFQQNCDIEGLGEEKEQTHRRTNTRNNRLEGGGWWEGGCLEGLGGRTERGGGRLNCPLMSSTQVGRSFFCVAADLLGECSGRNFSCYSHGALSLWK